MLEFITRYSLESAAAKVQEGAPEVASEIGERANQAGKKTASVAEVSRIFFNVPSTARPGGRAFRLTYI